MHGERKEKEAALGCRTQATSTNNRFIGCYDSPEWVKTHDLVSRELVQWYFHIRIVVPTVQVHIHRTRIKHIW